MAKTKIIYSYLLCFLVCSGLVGQGTVKNSPLTPKGGIYNEMGIRKCVKELYDSQVGVREEGGDNRGVHVEWYLESVKLGPGYPWCAAFVSWCYQNVNVVAPHSGWVPSYALKSKRIYERGKFQKSIPQQGDVFMIWYSTKGRPAHIGFVDEWGDEWIITVEGNTNENGSREGDGVYRKRRMKRQIWAVSDFVGINQSQVSNTNGY